MRVTVVGAGAIGGTIGVLLHQAGNEVTLVDRDRLPEGPLPRKGVPQGPQAHGLHARGYLILSELFPGLLEEARQLIGLSIRDFGKMRWYFDARPIKPADTGLLSIAGSRPVLLRREKDVGHGARSVSRTVALSVDQLAFLADRLGLPL